MSSWFDLASLSPSGQEPEDEKGLLESVRTIQGLIGKETDVGIPANRVVVGGFSQGELAVRYTISVAILTWLSPFSPPILLSALVPFLPFSLHLAPTPSTTSPPPLHPFTTLTVTTTRRRSRHRSPHRRHLGAQARRSHLPLRFPRPL